MIAIGSICRPEGGGSVYYFWGMLVLGVCLLAGKYSISKNNLENCNLIWNQIYIVACQAHPAIVKIGLVLARLFHFNSLSVRLHLVKVLYMPVYGPNG